MKHSVKPCDSKCYFLNCLTSEVFNAFFLTLIYQLHMSRYQLISIPTQLEKCSIRIAEQNNNCLYEDVYQSLYD